jgi:hypothetical protein
MLSKARVKDNNLNNHYNRKGFGIENTLVLLKKIKEWKTMSS